MSQERARYEPRRIRTRCAVARPTAPAAVAAAVTVALVLEALSAAPAGAVPTPIPVAGQVLRMRASQRNPDSRRFTFRSALDPAIAVPFPDPTQGSLLRVFASHAAGQCRAVIALDPAKWEAIRGDGAGRGWRYRAGDPGTQGIRKIVITKRSSGGVIVMRGKGAGWPCGLEATDQRLPVWLELEIAASRYCAAFGGTITRNATGVLGARDASTPAACLDTDLTVANINILHGLFCPDDCRLGDRIALFYQWLQASGCPDIVTLQEVIDTQNLSTLPFLQSQNETVCPFPYEILYPGTNVADGELVLTRYPLLASEERTLQGGFRNALFARVDHPIGPVDVFTTHLASSSDGGPLPCGATCPQECVDAGAISTRDCQAVELARFALEKHDVDALAVVTGDFNDTPGTFVYDQFAGRGWIDTYLAAGNPECDAGTGIGCTSGRGSGTLAEIESTAANVDERIDYTFLIAQAAG